MRHSFPILAVVLLAGCTAADEQTVDMPPAAVEPAQDSPAVQVDASDSVECLTAHVADEVIQLHRVVVTFDIGAADGVKVGMRGQLANGRAFTVISVDVESSRAVIVGLNIRIGRGTGACIYLPGR